MLIALLSDVHANAPAMSAVREAIERERVDMVVAAGDIVGYYYWPKDVLDQLKLLEARMIRGNHEDMLASARSQIRSPGSSEISWGTAIEACLDQLSDAELDGLADLPRTRIESTEDGSAFICHGSPADPVRYVYPDTSDTDFEAIVVPGHRWIVMGHTHYPMRRDVVGTTFINPGSVGQPRNGTPGAAWALLDSSDNSVQFRVEEYDWDLVRREALSRDPDLPYLREVLVRQR